MIRLLARLAIAALVALGLVTIWVTFRIWQQGTRDEQRPVDAIVVLGAAQYDGRPSPVFRARLDHAIGLYDDGLAPTLVVTGGKVPGDRTTEAAVARAYAMSRAVPAESIIGENQGRNTLESLQGVATLLRARGLRTALFVSDRPHMLRVLRIARDLGIDAYGSPTTTSPLESDAGQQVDATLHELGALIVYFVAGNGPEVERPEG